MSYSKIVRKTISLLSFIVLLIVFSQKAFAAQCSSAGQACFTNSDCCSNLECASGVGGTNACANTLSCQGPGASCTSSNDCCIGDTCKNGNCQQNNLEDAGQVCQDNINCKSGNCTNNRCSANSPTPTPSPFQICPSQNGVCTNFDTALGNINVSGPGGFIKTLFGLILSLSGGTALILIIISAYRIMVAQGDEEKIKGAREMLTSAIIGLLFTIFSVTILQILGVNILRLPGFK